MNHLSPSVRPPPLAVLGACVLLLAAAGCASTPAPVARAEKRPGFANVPERQRQLALAGEVRPGMNVDTVFVAWGKPTHVYHGRGKGNRALESWVYLRPISAYPTADFTNFPPAYNAARLDFLAAYYRHDRFVNAPGAIDSRFYPGATFYPGPVTEPFGNYQPVLERQAVFENGRVVRFVSLAREAVGP